MPLPPNPARDAVPAAQLPRTPRLPGKDAAVPCTAPAPRAALPSAAVDAADGRGGGSLGPPRVADKLPTKLLSPPAVASSIPPVRRAAGSLASGGKAIAEALNAHFSGISARRPADQAAQQQVLGALQAQVAAGSVRTIPTTAAAAAGAAEVIEAEVIAASRAAPTASSPGLDGIPYSLWSLEDFVWAGLLARLFTAAATVGRLPAGFLRGWQGVAHPLACAHPRARPT